MKDKLFIPERINTGFQERGGTYTGKLAYIIYWNTKNKLCKETSWQSWRDKKIDPIEFKNVPTEGFVLNKGVGGVKGSWSSRNVRNEYIRVYDPRDFEFEISVANLLFILQECSAIKGKGLEGEFVYAWDGPELVLLPVDSEDYKASSDFTGLKSKKITKDNVRPGLEYLDKKGENLVYIGREIWNNRGNIDKYYKYYTYAYAPLTLKRAHIFWNRKQKNFQQHSGFTELALQLTEEPVLDHATILTNFGKTRHGKEIVGYAFSDSYPSEMANYVSQGQRYYSRLKIPLFEEIGANKFKMYLFHIPYTYYGGRDRVTLEFSHYCEIKNGEFIKTKGEEDSTEYDVITVRKAIEKLKPLKLQIAGGEWLDYNENYEERTKKRKLTEIEYE